MKYIYLLFVFFYLSFSVFSQKRSVQKEIFKTFTISPSTTLNINNAYGDINFEIWQKNEIEIRVVMEVITERVKHINRYIEAISIIESGDSNQIIFTTKIEGSKLDYSFNSGKSSHKISYYIKHPVYLNVNINNSYGNVYIDEISGNFLLRLNRGVAYINNLTADETKKMPRIILNHAKSVIKKVQFLEADLTNAKINVSKSTTISIVSRYSKIELNDVRLIKLNSKYDDVYVDNAYKLNVRSSYSNLNVIQINGFADINATYGLVNIKKISNEFSEGYFDVTFANLSINLDYDICLQLNAHVKYGDIKVPKRSNVDNYISFKDIRSKGTIGCVSGFSGNLNISAEFSDVVITN